MMGLVKPTENTRGTKPVAHNDTVFAQVLKLVPRHEFESLARKHKSGRMSRSMTRWGQFVAMGMAQLTGRCSLRDIVSNLAAQSCKLYHLGAFRPQHDVWVENGRIRAVGPALDLPDGLARVDGGGRTLVPGLIDGHAHSFDTTLNDSVRFGVTSVLDQFTHPALAASKRAARETLARGDEADLFTAGMLATVAGGHGTQFGLPVEPVGGPAEAADWVRARKAEGSDWIKIAYEDGSTFGADIPSLDGETIRALIAAAHAERLLAVVHVSTLAHALEAVDLGADGLVHVWGDAVVDEVQAARIAEAGAFVVPTLSVVTATAGDGMGRELLEAGTPAAPWLVGYAPCTGASYRCGGRTSAGCRTCGCSG